MNLGDASLRDLPLDKKWWIVRNADQWTKRGSLSSRKPVQQQWQQQAEKATDGTVVDKGSPAYYVNYFTRPQQKGQPLRILSDLAVRLRTMPLGWVKEFIEQRGMEVISNELSRIAAKTDRYFGFELVGKKREGRG